MRLTVVGLSHRCAPVHIREAAAFTRRAAAEAARELCAQPEICEVLVLSTCNRSEIYVISEDCDSEAAADYVKAFYLARAPQLEPYLYLYQSSRAAQHLFRVACGLDSMVLGEDQILGQLKDALALAQQTGTVKKYLTRTAETAIAFAKRVKQTYKLSEVPSSVSATAVKHIVRRFPETYKDKQVLLIGSGKTGRLTLRYLSHEGFKHVRMTNRTYHPGETYTGIYDALESVDYDRRYQALEDADIVISATASAHTVLKAQEMPVLKHPVYFYDLAVPRDIDPAIAELKNARLMAIDDFKAVIEARHEWQNQAAKQIEMEIENSVEELEAWAACTALDSVIAQVSQKTFEQARQTTLSLFQKLDLTPAQQKQVQKIVTSNFRALIMPAVLKMKTIDDPSEIARIKSAAALFSVQEDL